MMKQIAGYTFRDPALLRIALTHRSVGPDNNERLEYLGDAVLSLIIAEIFYNRFPKATEGELTLLRSGLVKRTTLSEIARSISLGKFIRFGPGEIKNNGERRDSILGDTLEAIIGAIYLDSDFTTCCNAVLELYQPWLEEMRLEETTKDPKTLLQEYMQENELPLPEYVVIDKIGAPHEQEFMVECRVKNIPPVVMCGKNKRSAEQETAKEALRLLNR